MKFKVIVFLSIFAVIYGFANFYVCYRGWQAIPEQLKFIKPLYISISIFLSGSYIIGRWLDKTSFDTINAILTWIGSFWVAALLYFILVLFVMDMTGLILHLFGVIPSSLFVNYSFFKFALLLSVSGLVLIILVVGYYNSTQPEIRSINIKIDKPGKIINELRIVAVSDIHMGLIVGKSRIVKMVKAINELNADVVVFAGDLLDGVQSHVIRNKTGEPITHIISKYGVFGITGNHEYMGGIQKSVQYINSLNVHLLRDVAYKIEDKFYLIGREDNYMFRFVNKHRKNLEDIMSDVDKSLPLILLDHQPFHLDNAVKNGIDLQISGHTHHGQLWPFNYITRKIFEVSKGLKQKGNTNIYVSQGFGTWGPPVRIGSRSEIVLFTLNCK